VIDLNGIPTIRVLDHQKDSGIVPKRKVFSTKHFQIISKIVYASSVFVAVIYVKLIRPHRLWHSRAHINVTILHGSLTNIETLRIDPFQLDKLIVPFWLTIQRIRIAFMSSMVMSWVDQNQRTCFLAVLDLLWSLQAMDNNFQDIEAKINMSQLILSCLEVG
jgi:hypothetical protein